MGFPKIQLARNGTLVILTMIELATIAGWKLGGVVISDPTLIGWFEINLPNVKRIMNNQPETGPIGSLRLAIDSTNDNDTGLLAWPIDHPLVGADALRRIWNVAEPSNTVIPCFEKRRGHPTWWGKASWNALNSSLADEGANRIIKSGLVTVNEVDVDDPGVVTNIDTVEAATLNALKRFE